MITWTVRYAIVDTLGEIRWLGTCSGVTSSVDLNHEDWRKEALARGSLARAIRENADRTTDAPPGRVVILAAIPERT